MMPTVIMQRLVRISSLILFSNTSNKSHFRFLAPLLHVHLLNLLFHDANGLVQPLRVTTHPLDFHGRKPFARILLRLAQRLEMSGPQQERHVIIRQSCLFSPDNEQIADGLNFKRKGFVMKE